MTPPTKPSTRGELGEFLRSRRERLSPEAAGLASGRRRRTPGLRREEVAELAGIGVDWYTRLEQGRDVSASAPTIEAIARALRLGGTEAAHLRALSRHGGQRPFERERVPAALERLLDDLAAPAYVTGRRWDILAWNAAAIDVFGRFDELRDGDRNILVHVLTAPAMKLLFGDTWAAEARRMVGQFRATHDMWAHDPAFVELRERLYRHCAEFPAWWDAHEVHPAGSGRKALQHATRGPLVFDYASLQSNDDPACKLVVYHEVRGNAPSGVSPHAGATR